MSEHDPLDPEALFQRLRALRGLAASLVGDEAAAEDVLQEVWIQSRSKGVEATRGVLGFLRGMVRIQSLRHRQSVARRERRELRAARPAIEAPADELAARVEISQRLLQAVKELEAPYGHVLWMRYLDGLEPAEIAQRLGRPPELVRTWLHRARQRLRERLDVELGEGRDWRGALAPLLVPLASLPPAAGLVAGATTGAAAPVVLGGLLVKVSIPLVALCFAGLAWLGWEIFARPESGTGGTSPGGLERTQEETNGSPSALFAEGAASTTREVARAVEESGTSPLGEPTRAARWTLGGRSVLAGGEGLAGARLRLELFAGYEAEGDPTAVEEVESDAKGLFVWSPSVVPSGVLCVRLRGEAPDHRAGALTRRISRGEAPPRDLELTFHPLDLVIRGSVRDLEGAPLAGALVTCWGEETRTASDGSYEMRGTTRYREQQVVAVADGYVRKREMAASVAAGGAVQVDFALGRAFRVRGRVLDAEGQGIANAEVLTFYTLGHPTRTDAEGRFVLDHLDPLRESHTLTARREGYVQGEARVSPMGLQELEQDLVLERGVRVRGRVLDTQEHPLEEVELYIGFSPFAFNRIDARTDEQGRFEFAAVGVGNQTLVAQKQGFAPERRILELSVGEPEHTVNLVLGTGHFVAGKVYDEGRLPVAGIRVSAQLAGEYLDNRADTEEDGSFRITGLPEGEVSLSFYGAEFERKALDLSALDVANLEVILERAGSLAGRVVDATTGLGLDDFTIRFVDAELQPGEEPTSGFSATWVREGFRFTNRDGRWGTERENLPTGTWIGIEATAPGHGRATIPRAQVQQQPDPESLVIRLSAAASLTGRLLRADGEGVEGVRLLVRPAGQESVLLDAEPHQTGLAITDAEGRFVVEGIASGATKIWFFPGGIPAFTDGPFEALPGERVERTVSFPSGATLSGEVRDFRGDLVPGAEVTLRHDRSQRGEAETLHTRADVEGRFRFRDLPDARYWVGHRVEEGRASATIVTRRVEVVDGRAPHVVLRPEGSGRVSGSFVQSGKLPALIAVHLERQDRDAEGDGALGTLARDGSFRFDAVPPGRYSLVAYLFDGNGTWMGSAEVEVREGETAEVSLGLRHHGL